jgi:hypothetical protein
MILRNRFPDKHTAFKTFVAVAFPVHLWAIIITFQQFSSYALYLTISEILGIVAYTLASTLLECILITVLLIIIGVGLPQRFFKEKIASQAALLTPMALVVAYYVHSQDSKLFFYFQSYMRFEEWIVIWMFGMIPILIISYFVGKYQKFSELLSKYVDRITILSLVYIFCDLIAVVIVILRNLF